MGSMYGQRGDPSKPNVGGALPQNVSNADPYCPPPA
jgi:hypothetical protein